MHRLSIEPKTIIKKIINKIPQGPFRNLIISFPEKEVILGQLTQIKKKASNYPIFIFPPPSCPWGYMFQRPQQLARSLAEFGFQVIYCVDTSFPYEPDWAVRGIKTIEPNIHLYNDGQNGRLLNEIDHPVVIWQYWPHQLKYTSNYPENTTYIYDSIDHLMTFSGYPEIRDDYLTSLKRADIVLVTADHIASEVSKIRQDFINVPNGVCVEDFTNYLTDVSWTDLMYIRSNSSILVGYYGAIAEWVDLELLYFCAEKRPDWTFLITGQIYPGIKLRKKKNIIYMKRQEYKRIPYLLSTFDVAILPFKINEITLNTSPVKIFEYMAGGKPIVSTRLPEVEKYPLVFLADSREEFLQKIEIALQYKNNSIYIEKLKKCATENTWRERTKKVVDALKLLGVIKHESFGISNCSV